MMIAVMKMTTKNKNDEGRSIASDPCDHCDQVEKCEDPTFPCEVKELRAYHDKHLTRSCVYLAVLLMVTGMFITVMAGYEGAFGGVDIGMLTMLCAFGMGIAPGIIVGWESRNRQVQNQQARNEKFPIVYERFVESLTDAGLKIGILAGCATINDVHLHRGEHGYWVVATSVPGDKHLNPMPSGWFVHQDTFTKHQYDTEILRMEAEDE